MGKWIFTDKNGNEIMPLGVQAHNSSTESGLIRRALRTLKLFGGNTLKRRYIGIRWRRKREALIFL